MKPSAFACHRPRSLHETLDPLDDHGAVPAGGQSVVPLMSKRAAR